MTKLTNKGIILIIAIVLVIAVPIQGLGGYSLSYGPIYSGNESNTIFAGIAPIYKYNTSETGFGQEEGLYQGYFGVEDINGGQAVKLTYLQEVKDQDGNIHIIDTVYVKAGNFYTAVKIYPELKVGDTVVFRSEDHGITNPNGTSFLDISHIGIYPGATRVDIASVQVRRSFYLAAHAATVKIVNGIQVQSETLWAAEGAPGSNRFTARGSWATYIHFDDLGQGVIEGQEKVYNLYAGQHIYVGSLTVWFDKQNIYVRYATIDGWYLQESHLDIAELFTGLMGTRGLGRYPYTQTYNPLTNEHTYIIPLPSEGFGI